MPPTPWIPLHSCPLMADHRFDELINLINRSTTDRKWGVWDVGWGINTADGSITGATHGEYGGYSRRVRGLLTESTGQRIASRMQRRHKSVMASPVDRLFVHYSDVIMGAMASQITSITIVYPTFIQAHIKENTKAPRHWPLCEEFTGDRWIPRPNGQ